jgi:integrase
MRDRRQEIQMARHPQARPEEVILDDNPVRLYLASLSPGSQWAMRHALETIASLLSGGRSRAEAFPWCGMGFRETATVRSTLARRYKPATVNRMLSALRGVLRHAWRLGRLDGEAYQRAVDFKNLSGKSLPRGRTLSGEELRALFATCAENPSPAGERDAALLAVLYGGGLRRAEAAALDISDFDPDARVLYVRHGKDRRERIAYLTTSSCRCLKAWIRKRGDAPGPLFCPVNRAGRVGTRRMRGECIAYILRRRQEQADLQPFSPHDLRRSFISDLLSSGADTFTVQDLAGHADPVTTARYDRRREAVKREVAGWLSIPSGGRNRAMSLIRKREDRPLSN